MTQPQERASYYVLCERAWLLWSRSALDHITTRSIKQRTAGAFTPERVRSARESREAAVRCGVHWQLLDATGRVLRDPAWAWRLEAARQVHASTQKALRIGGAVGPHERLDMQQLQTGIQSAADALLAAIAAEFVTDGAAEALETVRQMAALEGVL